MVTLSFSDGIPFKGSLAGLAGSHRLTVALQLLSHPIYIVPMGSYTCQSNFHDPLEHGIPSTYILPIWRRY